MISKITPRLPLRQTYPARPTTQLPLTRSWNRISSGRLISQRIRTPARSWRAAQTRSSGVGTAVLILSLSTHPEPDKGSPPPCRLLLRHILLRSDESHRFILERRDRGLDRADSGSHRGFSSPTTLSSSCDAYQNLSQFHSPFSVSPQPTAHRSKPSLFLQRSPFIKLQR